MNSQRASFTSDVVTILFGILPDHITPAGGKTNWEVVATTLNTRTGKNFTSQSIKNWFTHMKEKHKAWTELNSWTGIGWSDNGCPIVDVQTEKWVAFAKKYKSNAKALLKNPLENEDEWNKILRGGYATGDRSRTPVSLGRKQKEVLLNEDDVDGESSGESDDIEIPNNDIQPYNVSSESTKRKSRDSNSIASMTSRKKSRDEDIDACLEQMKRSSLIQSPKFKNCYDEVLNILETMGIVAKYGEAFAVDILESFRNTPGSVDIFTALRSDTGRLHYLRKHCLLDDDVYIPDTSFDV